MEREFSSCFDGAKHVHGNPLGYRAEIPDTLSIQLGGPPFS